MTAAAIALFLVMAATLIGNLEYLRRRAVPETAPECGPTVDVLIPARNEEANIARLLQSLLRQSYCSFRVVVYDDASDDATGEIVRTYMHDPRIALELGAGPPPGWTGKPHALYEATRETSADLYLFLDADVELCRPDSLARIVAAFVALPSRSVLTSLPRLEGGGLLLVSVIPNIMLMMLPWFLVRGRRVRSMGAVAGHCWMIARADYHEAEPHLQVRGEILEDVRIGQYLRSINIVPSLADLTRDVSVYMYSSLGEAWRGLSKNSFLIAGGGFARWTVVMVCFVFTFVLAPIVHPKLLFAIYGLKMVSDRVASIPLRVSLLAPVSYVLAAGVQIASALQHLSGGVMWKGRRVGARS